MKMTFSVRLIIIYLCFVAGKVESFQSLAVKKRQLHEPKISIASEKHVTRTYFSTYPSGDAQKQSFLGSTMDPVTSETQNQERIPFRGLMDDPLKNQLSLKYVYLLPIITPMLGFLGFDFLEDTLHAVILELGNQKWVAVDGGQYQAAILVSYYAVLVY